MSSLPGLSLEDFVAWQHSVVVEGQSDPNFSVGMAEFLSNVPLRPRIEENYFNKVLKLYEPWRVQVEDRLRDFDEETQSWRSYASYCFTFLPKAIEDVAYNLLRTPAITLDEKTLQAAWVSSDNELVEISRELDITHELYKRPENKKNTEAYARMLLPDRIKAVKLGELRQYLCELQQRLTA
jgi:hypothetical protein